MVKRKNSLFILGFNEFFFFFQYLENCIKKKNFENIKIIKIIIQSEEIV